MDESALCREKSITSLRGKVSPYSAEDIDAAHLSLLTLVHLITTCSNIQSNAPNNQTSSANQNEEIDAKSPTTVSTGFRQYRSKSQSPMMMKRQGSQTGWQDPNYLLGEHLRESGTLVSLANIVCDEVSNAISTRESSTNDDLHSSSVWDWKLLHSLQLLEFSASQSELNQYCLSQDPPTTSPNKHKSDLKPSNYLSNGNEYNLSPSTFMKQNENCCNIIPSLIELIRISYEKLYEEDKISETSPSSSSTTKSSYFPSKQVGPSHREILACSLKVLINLTHHHPLGVNSLVEYGVLPLVNCVLFHNQHVIRGWKNKNEEVNNEIVNTSPIKNGSQKKEEYGNMFEDSQDLTPRKVNDLSGSEDATYADVIPHFDLLLLSLTVLTNCAEISAISRNILSSIYIQKLNNQDIQEEEDVSYRIVPKFKNDGDKDVHDFCSFLCLLLRNTLSNFKTELGEELKPSLMIQDRNEESQSNPSSSMNDEKEEKKKQCIKDGDETIDKVKNINEETSLDNLGDGSSSGWEVEELVVSSYFSLLLGCLIRGENDNRDIVKLKLSLKYDPHPYEEEGNDLFKDQDISYSDGPLVSSRNVCDDGLKVLVRVLTAFVALQSSAGVLTAMSLAPVLALIDEVSGSNQLLSLPTLDPTPRLDSESLKTRAQTLPSSLKFTSENKPISQTSSQEFSQDSSSNISKHVKKKTYGNSKKTQKDDDAYALFNDSDNDDGVDSTTGKSVISDSGSTLTRCKTWPSPVKEVKESKKKSKNYKTSSSASSSSSLASKTKSIVNVKKRLKGCDQDKDETAYSDKEDDIFHDSLMESKSEVKRPKCDVLLNETEEGIIKKVSTQKKRIKLVKSNITPATSSHQAIKQTSSLSKEITTTTLSRASSISSNTSFSSKRSLSLKKHVLETEQTSSLNVGMEEYKVGDHVKVTCRSQPGFNKPGGIGRLTKIHRSSFDDSLIFDVKYVLGGSEKSLPLHLLQPYAINGHESLSRSSSSSSTRRSARSGHVKGVDGVEEEEDIFGCSQELSLLGMCKTTLQVTTSDIAGGLGQRQVSDSSDRSSFSSQAQGEMSLLSNKRKKTRGGQEKRN